MFCAFNLLQTVYVAALVTGFFCYITACVVLVNVFSSWVGIRAVLGPFKQNPVRTRTDLMSEILLT